MVPPSRTSSRLSITSSRLQIRPNPNPWDINMIPTVSGVSSGYSSKALMSCDLVIRHLSGRWAGCGCAERGASVQPIISEFCSRVNVANCDSHSRACDGDCKLDANGMYARAMPLSHNATAMPLNMWQNATQCQKVWQNATVVEFTFDS